MKGLDLSRAHWERVVAPAVAGRFPSLVSRLAAGLVGEGSECFGFDDDLSRDHDFDPTPCLWLSPTDFAEHGQALAALLASLPPPPRSPHLTGEGRGRRGVFETGAFYRRFLGLPRAPRSLDEWRAVPEAGLAAASNGSLFAAPPGEFTSVRADLLSFYPEELRLARLARRLHAAGQSGQYNLERCLRRGEGVAALLAVAGFADAAIAAAFLLARRHRPFAKWAHRALAEIPFPGPRLHVLLDELPSAAPGAKCEIVETAAALLAGELRARGLSDADGTFLVDHARSVAGRVGDPLLRRLAGAA